MNIYEKFPNIKSPTDLTQEESTAFIEANIWPAADYFWGESYHIPSDLDDHQVVWWGKESDDGKNKLTVNFSVDAYYPTSQENNEDEHTIEDLFVGLDINVFRPDLTNLYSKTSPKQAEVWEILSYEFPLDRSAPFVKSYYAFWNEDEEVEPDRMSYKQKEFIEKITYMSRFSVDRSGELNSQDAIDIHNVLLVIGVPDGVISLTGNT